MASSVVPRPALGSALGDRALPGPAVVAVARGVPLKPARQRPIPTANISHGAGAMLPFDAVSLILAHGLVSLSMTAVLLAPRPGWAPRAAASAAGCWPTWR